MQLSGHKEAEPLLSRQAQHPEDGPTEDLGCLSRISKMRRSKKILLYEPPM
jgi:hypothetical protein